MPDEPVDKVEIDAAELVNLRGLAGQMQALETSTAQALIERDLASALSGYELSTPQAAAQLIRLIRDDIKATRAADGSWKVAAPDGKSVADYLKAVIPTEFPNFVRATNRGGSGGNGASATPTVVPTHGQNFETFGHALVAANQGNGFGAVAFTAKYK